MAHRIPYRISHGALWLHRRLLPPDGATGWLPYVWLAWLGFLFVPWAYGPVSAATLTATLLATLLFLPLYFRCYWAQAAEGGMIIAAIAALGAVLIPFNSSGGGIIIYAGAFAGYHFRPRTACLVIAGLGLLSIAVYALAGFSPIQWFWAPTVTIMVGLANVWGAERHRQQCALRRSQEEVRRLAATAERERIARDLHDLLGHTLTLISVKAELAARLAERDLPDAGREIRELEGIAREALAQVRHAVGGYRSDGIGGEIVSARLALRTAGIEFDVDAAGGVDTGGQDTTLALVVREAVTNVVRHANARHCRVALRNENAAVVLEVSDDGRGGWVAAGNGIRGMRERLRAVGGTLRLDSGTDGTRLCASIPLAPREAPALQGQPA